MRCYPWAVTSQNVPWHCQISLGGQRNHKSILTLIHISQPHSSPTSSEKLAWATSAHIGFCFLWSPVLITAAIVRCTIQSSTALIWPLWEDGPENGPGDKDLVQAPWQTYYIRVNKLLPFCQGDPSFLSCQIKCGARSDIFNHVP